MTASTDPGQRAALLATAIDIGTAVAAGLEDERHAGCGDLGSARARIERATARLRAWNPDTDPDPIIALRLITAHGKRGPVATSPALALLALTDLDAEAACLVASPIEQWNCNHLGVGATTTDVTWAWQHDEHDDDLFELTAADDTIWDLDLICWVDRRSSTADPSATFVAPSAVAAHPGADQLYSRLRGSGMNAQQATDATLDAVTAHPPSRHARPGTPPAHRR